MPLANDFHDKNEESNCYPLNLMICKNCFHCQLSIAINPNILFKNYKYISGTNCTIVKFFEYNADFITGYKEKGNILDIACNDGTQLDSFKKRGWNTYGVDPATNLYETSSKNHKIVCDFWNIDVAKKLPIMNVILAQNVFAHTKYVDEFLCACKLIMDSNTSLFIQTSQKNMIINNEFDTIYHEHISFFNAKSMNILVSRNGLVLNRVIENDIHGTSYIFEIKLSKDASIYNIDDIIQQEHILYDTSTYEHFSKNSMNSLINLTTTINTYKNNDYKCIGYGASAKGQTVLCYGNIQLDYIIDESPLKIGLFSPKLNIPIVDLNHFIEDTSDKYLIVLLAWNFAEEIISKLTHLKKNIKLVKYFPTIEIIDCTNMDKNLIDTPYKTYAEA
jgi:hypothetical protein